MAKGSGNLTTFNFMTVWERYMKPVTEEEFRRRLKRVHGSAIVLSGPFAVGGKVTLMCRYGHSWSALKGNVLKGSGCKQCDVQERRLTDAEIKKRLFDARGAAITYEGRSSRSGYINVRGSCGHLWTALQSNLLGRAKSGCPSCSRKLSLSEFYSRLAKVAPNVRVTSYRALSDSVAYYCGDCNTEHSSLASDLCRRGCPVCNMLAGAKSRRLTEARFKKRLTERNARLVLAGPFTDLKTEVQVRCLDCNYSFTRVAERLVCAKDRSRCPGCRPAKYSSISIEWLVTLQKRNRRRIQHAENGGEYEIPGTRFKADGYHKRTNTIFEFLGDYWHGHTKEWLDKTISRLQSLVEKGYNVVYIWEYEYRLGKPAHYLRTPKDFDMLRAGAHVVRKIK